MKNPICIKCGYCCTVGPCKFGEWDEEKEQCKHLLEPNNVGQRYCKLWPTFVQKESEGYGMCNCGCSSAFHNEVRADVAQKIVFYMTKGKFAYAARSNVLS